jgi:fructose/tagatose bisphosphate aldolase
MHQDHGQSPVVCQGAIDLGFSSVMMDGSLLEDGKTPADFARICIEKGLYQPIIRELEKF